MIYLKTDEEIQKIKESCILVCKTLAEVASFLKPGVTGSKLNSIAEEFIRSNDAIPSFLGYKNFPASLCISKNEVVVHGIPNGEVFKDGDIVSIDCGVYKNGFHGDSAYTFIIGDTNAEVKKLLRITCESLYEGIKMAVAGNRIGDIGCAVQTHTEVKQHYGVVRELVGHGLGKNLHEAPEVPNYGKRGKGPMLKEGLVIAIEPMINLGTRKVKQKEDGWTIVTADKKPSAHYEHTIVVRKNEAEILSDHSFIEKSIKNNNELGNFS
ncbi:MAG: type I methionyl aminopeptidase [Saprospiraceae bacterium]|jgi:methionyl aminopeptidase